MTQGYISAKVTNGEMRHRDLSILFGSNLPKDCQVFLGTKDISNTVTRIQLDLKAESTLKLKLFSEVFDD